MGWERGSADVFAGLFNPAKACATERGGDNYFCTNFSHDLIKWCLNITISSSGVSGDSSQCQNANIRKQCLQSLQSWNDLSISSSGFGCVKITAVVRASRAFLFVLFFSIIVLFVTFWKSNVRYTVRTFFVLSHQASIFLRM